MVKSFFMNSQTMESVMTNYMDQASSKVKVGVLHPVQQPGTGHTGTPHQLCHFLESNPHRGDSL